MSTTEFRDYVNLMKDKLLDLHIKQTRKYKLFEREESCLFYKIDILTAYIDFLENYFESELLHKPHF